MSSTHRHLLLDFFWQVISGPPCILRGCLIPCLPRVPKKATQCVPECCILRRRMYSVIIFIFTHVTKLHFSVFTKTREKREKNIRKTREKQELIMSITITDLQMSIVIVKTLAIDLAQSKLVQVV
jgi:hypothetical protein